MTWELSEAKIDSRTGNQTPQPLRCTNRTQQQDEGMDGITRIHSTYGMSGDFRLSISFRKQQYT